MFLRTIILRKNCFNLLAVRKFSETIIGTGTAQQKTQEKGIPDVPGLSSKIVKTTGAKTDGEYKVPEYFCFNKTSYYEAEIEMSQFRCPQPVAK